MSSTSIRDGGIGAAVGVIIGILLGAAFVWFYSAKQRQDRSGEPVVYLRDPPGEPVEFLKFAPKVLTTMEHFHLCRKDGPDLRKALGMTCAGFSMHTRNYYHTDKLPEVPESLDENLRRLFLGEELTRALKELIMNPKTRFHALTHLQVRVVLSNLDIHTIGPLSLLPLFVTEFFKSLPLSTSSYTAQPKSHGLMPLALWRKLTAYSMATPKGLLPGPVEPPEIVDMQVNRLFNALADVLDPFAKDIEDCVVTHRQALKRQISFAVKFGYEIFSHGIEYQFQWQPEPSKDGIVVVPGLAELADDDATPHWNPKIMEGTPEIRIPRKDPW
ncbi:hypothetical protein X797_010582 [Metarhizium robertsii]|uniref:Uncharacterized protein n=2 Tax=Metarhizium robertsii TaxID=568076 RepID=E9FC37_METRA|nr:uncharacterized protein MAA_09836 [Metarhizium robertsii ARSEF 23]EFY94712.1 hypothetical protein MAA_09836 [Metarhizium robertsii ARSEF 23]EXU96321.1 hypothetical protein X797_010582 [Metarhizium robertsii]